MSRRVRIIALAAALVASGITGYLLLAPPAGADGPYYDVMFKPDPDTCESCDPAYESHGFLCAVTGCTIQSERPTGVQCHYYCEQLAP